MCLKYFIRHSTCDHHEYLGSHHCSLRPCDLDRQHFHYLEDNFPIPWPEDLQAERAALACKICATKQRNELEPDEAPVRSYAPTNNFQVKEIRPIGYTLPVNVIRVAEDDMTKESTTEDEDSDDSFDYDYKSLSDADDEEWNVQKDGHQNFVYDRAHDEVLAQRHRKTPSEPAQGPSQLPHATAAIFAVCTTWTDGRSLRNGELPPLPNAAHGAFHTSIGAFNTAMARRYGLSIFGTNKGNSNAS
ncbi:hypothetical protein N0V86_002582 [Didymella sp. IMI 355093]|nr:hypothetical protein N0V86_002582 [Didymella sp. IMI 355093]